MRKVGLVLIVLLVLGVFVGASSAQEGIPEHTECMFDATGQTITIHHIGDLSGPFAPITQPLLAGFDDAIGWFNEHGGLCGATLAQSPNDTGSDRSLTQAHYDRVSTEIHPPLLVLYSSDDSELLRNQLAEDEISVLISAGSIEGLYGEDAASPGWSFATNPLYVDQLGSFCDWAAENIDDPVLGYIGWDTAFGHAAFTPEATAYCESVGVEVVDDAEFYSPAATDISAQIQNLVDAGANILYNQSLATGPALVAATVVNMGLEDSVTLAGVNWALDTSVGLLGQSTFGADGLPSTNGIVGSVPFRWWTELDNPGIQLITEVADANERPPTVRNIAYLLGWQTVDLFIEAYIQTANREGGFENITGAAIRETLETMEYSPLGLFDVDYADGALRDTSANRIGVLEYLGENGGPAGPDNPPVVQTAGDQQFLIPIVVPLTDFEETPDLRPGGADVPTE